MTHADFLARLLDDATAPYRKAGRFAHGFARGKLSSDCIFRELLRLGIFPKAARFLDLGCGQAGFAVWLASARKFYERGDWPADWPEPARVIDWRGFELMEKDVARARAALGDDFPEIDIRQGDITHTDFGQADVVTILDVLHYIDYSGQKDILQRVFAALPPGGLFLTRVGDADAGLPYHICNWVDRAVTFVRGHRLPQLYCRPLREWIEQLRGIGFSVETLPMSEGKPFANVMLVCRVPQ